MNANGVDRNKRTVKAGVCGRQAVLISIIAMNIEAVDAVHAFELFKSIERYLASTGDKLQQLGQFFLVKRSDSPPEPLDLWRRRIVVVILSISFPIVNINVWETRDQ